MDAPVWDVTVLTKNGSACWQATSRSRSCCRSWAIRRSSGSSSEHLSADDTLIDVWASMKSFRRKVGSDDDPSGSGRNAERDFHGDKRSNETHASVTDRMPGSIASPAATLPALHHGRTC